MTVPFDGLDRLGLGDPFDPTGAERRAQERDCAILRRTIVRLLEHQSDPVDCELIDLVGVVSLDRLERIALALAEGRTAGALCQDLGIPLSRRRRP